ncbi:ABC transporter substrate-binding protein, partial [Paenibacillus farraposensis]
MKNRIWRRALGLAAGLAAALALAAGSLAPQSTQAADDGTFKVGMEAGYAPFNWTQSTSANGAVKIEGSSEWAN